MALETYRQKRNFRKTSEPQGRKAPARRSSGHSFVVQKHDARSLHYDFRLELGGVMLSWAVPKGPSLDPKVKRLAMQTEDHPIEYSDFEGIIPEGEYGGGTVLVWDRGTWKPEGDPEEMYRRGRLTFELDGQKLHGSFHLVRTPSTGRSKGKASERKWLLFKSNDAAARPGSDAELLASQPLSVASGRDIAEIAADPDHVWTSKAAHNVAKARRAARSSAVASEPAPSLEGRAGVERAPLPAFVEPQLATLSSEAPEGQDWLHEIKLDGYRIQARVEQGRAQLLSRRGHDWSSRLPSIASALGALPVQSALLDGELVVLRDDGISDFQLLQNSLEAGKDGSCVYFAFDALFLDGYDLRQLPLSERKALLRPLIERAGNPRVRFGDHIRGTGPAFFEQACRRGLEGIVCKRADAPYSSGRGRGWLKVKCLSVQEFVVGGFTEPAGSRSHLGALLVGVRDGKVLRYAGKVGTGFTQASLAELAKRLKPLERSEPAFENPPHGAERRGVHWVEPRLVAQIAFVERTRDGLIRHASFHGLRDDKSSDEVKLERPEPKGKAKVKAEPKQQRATKAATRRSKTQPARAPAKIELDLSRIEITHPDRVLYPDQGLTKRDLMLHYARVARWMLPHVSDRPLMLVRCPEGEDGQCFHQKHPSRGMPKAVQQVTVQQKKGPEANLMVRDVEGLLGLVQMGALEIHTWGCRADSLEFPDQLVFDLDPDEGLAWQRVVEAAQALRERLEARGLTAFLKWTGGKGLHLVTPIEPRTPWDQAKAFSKRVADALVKEEPARYIATMTKQKRKGKIFIDYFRNGQGATAVCAYSTRARPGAPVALPLAWEELNQRLKPGAFNVQNLAQYLAQRERDPWAEFDDARVALPC
ncbi:MAG TPA: DNA ligase D [Polyangiaceae bacterium]|nr:DNA ligase D [Polyangiaceae bacterium]